MFPDRDRRVIVPDPVRNDRVQPSYGRQAGFHCRVDRGARRDVGALSRLAILDRVLERLDVSLEVAQEVLGDVVADELLRQRRGVAGTAVTAANARPPRADWGKRWA